ncbi:MAG: response regulator transcription factor [Bacteroidales bacterium]|nr:response regulator transcription factor [Bacteroidales bacterium]MDZ4204323.1 response regulator transcription factor [Bacteroidales bacterium]
MLNNKSIKILVAEDDPNLSILLFDYLHKILGYKVECAGDGRQSWKLFQQGSFDMCILDVMMPHLDGFELAEKIREKNSSIPIIFLTARGLQEDRVKGFKAGCDDYVTKPFNSEELGLRIEAILKRCGIIQEEELYHIGNYTFDAVNMVLSSHKGSQSLTTKESALLRQLCRLMNNLLTREKALKEVWGDENYFVGRSMDVFIARLRKYLKGDPNVRIINVHGAGFRLEVKE